MGLNEFKRNQQAQQSIQTQATTPAEAVQQQAPQPVTATTQQSAQQSTQAQDQLMAWAVEQEGQVAIPTEIIVIGQQVEKPRFKSPVVTPVYGKEDFRLTRARAIQEKLPQLYEEEGTQHLVETAAQEVDLTLQDRLSQGKAPELVLLHKLNQLQKSPASADLDSLRQELSAFGLTSGEERVPLEGAFTPEETLVLMVANLCNHLQLKIQGKAVKGKEISSALQAIDSLAHSTNTYANVLVGKVYSRNRSLLARRAQDQQATAEAQRLEAEQSASLRNLRNRRENTALLGQFLQRKAKGLAGLDNPAALQTAKEELLALMDAHMTMELLDEPEAQETFQRLLEEQLLLCSSYQRSSRAEADIQRLLTDYQVPESLRPILRSDQRFLDCFFQEGQEATQAYVTKLTQAVTQSKGLAQARFVAHLPNLSPQQQEEMVEQLSRQMPSLFLGANTAQLYRQVDLLAGYHRLMMPQMGQSVTLTPGDALTAEPPPLASELAGELLSQFDPQDVIFQFLPAEGAQACLEEELLRHLARKSLGSQMPPASKADATLLEHQIQLRSVAITQSTATALANLQRQFPQGGEALEKERTRLQQVEIDSIQRLRREVYFAHNQKRCLELGKHALKELDVLQRRQLMEELADGLRTTSALAGAALAQESEQLRQHLLGDLLDGATIEQIGLRATALREELKETATARKHMVALDALAPIPADGSQMVSDFSASQYNSATGSARTLRSLPRFQRMDADLKERGIPEPQHFRRFVVDAIGAEALNQLSRGDYEARLTEITTVITANLTAATAQIAEMEGHTIGLKKERAAILSNLYPLMVSQSPEVFSLTLKTIRASFSSGTARTELRTHSQRQASRMDSLKQQYPTLASEDLRQIFDQEGDRLAICTQSDSQWQEYAHQRITQVLPVLQLIDRDFSYIKDLPQQLRLVFGSDIYQGSYTLADASNIFRAHYESLVTRKVDKTFFSAQSIEASVNGLLEKVQKTPEEKKVLSSYFLFLLADCTLAQVLELDKVWAERGAEITSRVLANHTLVESFLQKQTKGLVPGEAERLGTGFLLYLRQAICTQDSDSLQDGLTAQWDTFSQLDGATKADTLNAHVTMAQRVTVLREIESHRKESLTLLSQEEVQRSQLYDIQTGQQSLFRQAVQKGREDWSPSDGKTGEKALVKLQKKEHKAQPDGTQPSPAITGVLAEYLSCRSDFSQVIKSEATLHQANQKITQLEEAVRSQCQSLQFSNIEEIVGKTVVLALSLHGQGKLDGLNLLSGGLMDDAIPDQMLREHLRREELLATATLKDATQKELLGLSSLTATSQDFDQAVSDRKTREAVITATTTMAQEVIDSLGWTEDKAISVLHSWLIYRHKDILEQGQQHPDVLRTMAETDFANPQLVDLLLTVTSRDVHQSYFDKGTLASGGSDTLSQEEQKEGALASLNREGFEGWLSTQGSADQLQRYSALSREERQLFAFGLSMPAHLLGIGATSAGKLLQSTAPEVGGQLATRQLQQFLLTGDTTGLDQLDYQRSVAGLTATKGKRGLNKQTFSCALAFAAFCIQARREALPPDAQRLCDARASIQAAGKDVPPLSCHTTEELRSFLVNPTSELPEALQKQLEGLDGSKLLLLVNLLQNRTLLDRSCISTEEEKPYVDQEGRETLVSQYASNLPQALLSLSSAVSTVEQAFLALHSYQVQDGLELGETLHKSDLHQEGYQRSTALDVNLLHSALTMVDEVFQEGLRLQAVSNAPQLIAQSGNQAAQTLYEATKGQMNSEADFNAVIHQQVEAQLHAHMGQEKDLDRADSELLGLYAAYQGLNQQERNLFFKAMASRGVLDVSKEGIMGNRFGFKNRDFVNPVARNQLLDEYTTTGDVIEEDQAIQKAFASLLSSQVDDTQDWEAVQREGGSLATSQRNTAVDWKLFKRALQLVRRANNERETYNGQFELYVSTGNVHQEGNFHFESDFLRRNLHSAGNRLTRFLGRRAVAQTVGRVADALGDQVSDNLCNLLGSRVSDAVEDMLSPGELEEQVELSKARQLELSQEFTSLVMKSQDVDLLKSLNLSNDALSDVAEQAGHALGQTVSTVAGNLLEIGEHAMEIYEGAKGISALKEGLKQAAEARGQDDALQEQAKERQTQAQQNRFATARGKLDSDLSQASHSAKERQVDAITEGVGEMVCSVLSVDALEGFPVAKVAGELINEAMKIINFARAAFDEKKMVDRNLEADQLWAEKKDALSQEFSQIGQCQAKTYDFALAASGFENMTEFASAKGLDFVQSLLFAASRYNALPSSKLLARTILTVLKVEQVSEDYHTLNANLVFDRLMGGKNR